ncbi:3'(2'),5'-bisphosphate nucleotidase CysQ [Isoalcanivorax indicus]|uniref:3'(2'),5'-bisphosphate nucleotidase CysQ n=1 Tax=Isoalcanivorax indicus TaxID=2202653 RepID=UPI000DB9109D|nr:3'(2'),5'-bisphosphate nucleotidase CysQ [Isoalcanivorax indicus]
MSGLAWLDPVARLAEAAGGAIMQVYRRDDLDVTHKADDSPVTAADLAAHRVIAEGLAALTPDLPLLSEESTDKDWDMRRQWSRFWLVDPLDGTREFIRRNDEFTVNIALIEAGEPVLGVVHAPVTGDTWLGVPGQGAWHQRPGHSRRAIRTREPEAPVALMASRRHGAEQVDALEAEIARVFGQVERVSMGSSLKLCRIAEGRADVYPRLAPTAEWDTAAAHAVVRAAGGEVLGPDFAPLRYHKQDLLNPHFLVIGTDPQRWRFLHGHY